MSTPLIPPIYSYPHSDEYPSIQTPLLLSPTTLFRFRSVPRSPRTRIDPSQHSSITWESVQWEIYRGSRGTEEGRVGEILGCRRRSSFTTGSSQLLLELRCHCASVLTNGFTVLNSRRDRKCCAHSYKTQVGTLLTTKRLSYSFPSTPSFVSAPPGELPT